MSMRYLTAAFYTDLKPNQKIVLLALADQANDDGVCWPSQKYIGIRCSMDPRTVRRHLRTLEENGMVITQAGRRKDGKNGSCIYHLDFNKIQGENLSAGDDKKESSGGQRCPSDQRSTVSAPITIIPKPSIENNNKKDLNLFGEKGDIPEILPEERYKQIWNSHSEKVPKWPIIRMMSPKRIKHIKARIKELGLDEFFAVVEHLVNSEFFCSVVENPDVRWFGPDWILKPDNMAKIIEGKYHSELRKHTADDPDAAEREFWEGIALNANSESSWPTDETLPGTNKSLIPAHCPQKFRKLFDNYLRNKLWPK